MGWGRDTHGWPDEAVNTFRGLWAAGLSASTCAGELWTRHRFAVSRSAVLGKAHRLGLPKRRTEPPPKRRRLAGSSVISDDGRKRGPNGFIRRDQPPDQSEFACTLMELRECSCRWPMGHPGTPEFRFCGTDKGGNLGPYCGRHTRIATGKPLKISDEERERRVRQAQQNYLKHGSREAPAT